MSGVEEHNGIKIHFTERDEHPWYGERTRHPDANLAQGYLEIWHTAEGRWSIIHETNGGGRLATHNSREDAIAESVEIAKEFIGYAEEKVAKKEAGDKTPDGRQYIRAGGGWYTIGPKNAGPNEMRGFAGRKFRFRMFETGEIIESTNVWWGGKIPTDYLERLPDNAELLEGNPPVRMI